MAHDPTDSIDPFAGVEAGGGLGGFDYDDPDTIGESDAPLVLEGRLDGTNDVEPDPLAEAQAEAEADAEFERAMEDERDAHAAAEAVLAQGGNGQPAAAQIEHTTPDAIAVPDATEATQPKKAKMGRPRKRDDKGSERGYVVLASGVLETGAPFWYIAAEVKATNAKQAVRKAFGLDFPQPQHDDGRNYWVVAADQWHAHPAFYVEKPVQMQPRTMRRVVIG